MGSDSIFATSIGRPILSDGVYALIRRLYRSADIPDKGTHALRHSFISIRGQHGRLVEVISDLAAHARASFPRDRHRTVFDEERKGLTLDFTALKSSTETTARNLPWTRRLF